MWHAAGIYLHSPQLPAVPRSHVLFFSGSFLWDWPPSYLIHTFPGGAIHFVHVWPINQHLTIPPVDCRGANYAMGPAAAPLTFFHPFRVAVEQRDQPCTQGALGLLLRGINSRMHWTLPKNHRTHKVLAIGTKSLTLSKPHCHSTPSAGE